MRSMSARVAILALTLLGFAAPSTAIAEGPVNHCVGWDKKSNSSADFVENNCAFKIWVTWKDEGHCRNWCSTDVPARDRTSATKTKGHVQFGACKYPSIPKRDGDSFTCR